MKSLQLLTFVSVLALAPAVGAFAQSNSTLSPNNPNCSPGVQGCTANYATTDHSDDVPGRPATNPKSSAMSPAANQATTDHSDDVPQRPATNPPAH